MNGRQVFDVAGNTELQEEKDLLQQIDLFDGTPPGLCGMGSVRIPPALRRLMDAGIVTIAIENGKVKVIATNGGRAFLAGVRGLRGRI